MTMKVGSNPGEMLEFVQDSRDFGLTKLELPWCGSAVCSRYQELMCAGTEAVYLCL